MPIRRCRRRRIRTCSTSSSWPRTHTSATWRAGAPRPELPAVEITEDVPADLGELSELDAVRTRLIERVAQHAPEVTGEDDRLPGLAPAEQLVSSPCIPRRDHPV